MTVPEVRRLLTRLVWTETKLPDFILSWSWWRQCHQAQARQCHVQTPPITSATVVLGMLDSAGRYNLPFNCPCNRAILRR